MDISSPTSEATGQSFRRRAWVLVVTILSIIVVYLPERSSFFTAFAGGPLAIAFLQFGLMTTIPFLLARTIPRAASFDVQWFPHKWSHWVWFLCMVVIVFLCTPLSRVLIGLVPLELAPLLGDPALATDLTLRNVVLFGVLFDLIVPIAEEVFYRGYLLEQLRKVVPSSVALFAQSILFALAHIPTSIPEKPLVAFFLGVVFGLWRIRLRSLFPLILAHVALNAIATIPFLTRQYDLVESAAKAQLPLDFSARMRSSPGCHEIYLLTKEPVKRAVPSVIGFLADSDTSARDYATYVLVEHYRNDAEPYLKEALASTDKKTVDGVLSVVGLGHWTGLKEEVRKVAFSNEDFHIQLSAALALWDLRDGEGLRKLAKEHPQVRIRKFAQARLDEMREKK